MPPKIEDLRFASSSIDAFFAPSPPLRTASAGRVRISSPRDLSGFAHVGADTLVHLSQKDFWQLGQDQEGYFIERLVDDSRGPVTEE